MIFLIGALIGFVIWYSFRIDHLAKISKEQKNYKKEIKIKQSFIEKEIEIQMTNTIIGCTDVLIYKGKPENAIMGLKLLDPDLKRIKDIKEVMNCGYDLTFIKGV